MPELSPKRLAFILATILSFITALISLAFLGIENHRYFLFLIPGTFIILLLFQYLVLKYTEKFIYDRIKLVYKSIHKLKLNRTIRKPAGKYAWRHYQQSEPGG
ncbi:MAG: hypothetical protein U0Z17_10415 [Bacteroidales bacterium]